MSVWVQEVTYVIGVYKFVVSFVYLKFATSRMHPPTILGTSHLIVAGDNVDAAMSSFLIFILFVFDPHIFP